MYSRRAMRCAASRCSGVAVARQSWQILARPVPFTLNRSSGSWRWQERQLRGITVLGESLSESGPFLDEAAGAIGLRLAFAPFVVVAVVLQHGHGLSLNLIEHLQAGAGCLPDQDARPLIRRHGNQSRSQVLQAKPNIVELALSQ